MVVHAKSKKEMREGETETLRDRDRKREKHTERQRPLQLPAEERWGLFWRPSGFALPVGFILN